MADSKPQPGDFVLEVAGLGREVIASFTRFITLRKIQERRLENVLAIVSITTSFLSELGTTINKYSKEAYIEDEVTRPTCQTCKADFSKLLIISNEAGERGLWLREGTLAGKNVTAEVDPWFLFNVGLGGATQSAEFFNRLEATRYSLGALTDTVKYKILKVLHLKNLLDTEQMEEFKSLTALLPQLVKVIDRAGQSKQERLEWEAKQVEKEKQLKSSRNRPEIGKKNESPPAELERKNSDAASELTMIEPNYDTKKNVHFAEHDDRRSLYSNDSYEEKYVQNHSMNLSQSDPSDTKEVLEEWRLRWCRDRRDHRETMSFLGLKFKTYYEDPGFWGVDAELRSQTELKDALHSLSSSTSDVRYRASVDKAMRSLPLLAREAVEALLDDRARSTSHRDVTRQWTVVAVRPRARYHFGDEGWFKTTKSQDWLVMLKGQTLSRADRKLPGRWDDPWRTPVKHGRRHSHSHSHSRMVEDDYYDYYDYDRYDSSRRVVSQERVTRPLSPLPPYEDDRHRMMWNADDDGYRPGTIVVGEVPDQKAAEKRMEEILTDLPGRFTV